MNSVRRLHLSEPLRQRHLTAVRALRLPILGRSLRVLVLTGVLAPGLQGCGSGTPDRGAATRLEKAALFTESAEAIGVRFRHENGRNGEFYYPEIIGPGVALLDYDNDGKLDIL